MRLYHFKMRIRMMNTKSEAFFAAFDFIKKICCHFMLGLEPT